MAVKVKPPTETDRHGNPVYRDMRGYRFTIVDFYDCYITDCCDASSKGSMDGVVCRACYREVDPYLGGIPYENLESTIGREPDETDLFFARINERALGKL